jgi:hypothetical protein
VAIVRQSTTGQYLIQVSETEFSLIKTAIEQAERVSRLGMEVLDEAYQAMDGSGLDRRRLRRETEALAVREASLRSLQETISETEPGEQSA